MMNMIVMIVITVLATMIMPIAVVAVAIVVVPFITSISHHESAHGARGRGNAPPPQTAVSLELGIVAVVPGRR